MRYQADEVIVGAGVMGLLTAYYCLKKGFSVILIEKNQVGKEASWASSGILSPLYPWRYDDAITELAYHSNRDYQVLANELFDETGIDCQFHQSGLLLMDCDDHEQAVSWAKQYQKPLFRLSDQELKSISPYYHPSEHQAYFMPDIAQIRPPRLCQALLAAMKKNNRFTCLEGKTISAWHKNDHHVFLAEGRQDQYSADHYIICTGAWSHPFLSTIEIDLNIVPVKGQIIASQTDMETRNWPMVLCNNRYLVPRRDGLILSGSTIEHTDFDKHLTDEAKATLWQHACHLYPKLINYGIQYHWAGLRSGYDQPYPVMGYLPPYDNLLINTGHFRNGIVLAPGSCQEIVKQIMMGNAFDKVPHQK